MRPTAGVRSAGRGLSGRRTQSDSAQAPAATSLANGLAEMQIIGTNNGVKAPDNKQGMPTARSHAVGVSNNGGAHSSRGHSGRARNSGEALSNNSSTLSQEQPANSNATGNGRDVVQSFAACIKVFCTSVAPCFSLPWMRGEESHTTGSGFAVRLPNGERRLVVHAQLLENYALVQVRRVQEAQRYVARVECVGYDVDVALLQVDDETFWRSMPLLTLTSGLPPPMSAVVMAGFPTSGEELATIRGVVNRILLGGATKELCVQMDAVINNGVNGGPVFDMHGQLVGMACSGTQHSSGQLASSQHASSYILPMPVIHTFLQNAAIAASNGHEYLGKSVDHYRVQPLENPELRQHLGLPTRPLEGEDGGVLLSKLGPDAVCEGVLRDGDVLLAVDGHPIAPDGTVPLPEAPGVRVGMRHCVQRVPLGTIIEYVVLREGKRLKLHVESSTRKPRLLPPRLPVPRPEWLVLGGLVFTPLLPDYEGLVPRVKLQDVHKPPTAECEQVVMLLRVLQSEVNIGYEDVCGMLESFNGQPVRSLAHLAQLSSEAEDASESLLEFMLVTGELLVLDAARCWQTEHDIFLTHAIPRRCSFDVVHS